MKVLLKILKNIPDCIFGFLFIPVWNFCGLFKRDRNLWIFVSWFGNKYNDSSRILFEYVKKNHPEIRVVWISKNKTIVENLRKNDFESYKANSLKALWLSFRAGKLFSTTGYEMFYGFTKGIEFYELWHGMPLKKIVNDDEFSGGSIRKTFLAKILYKINNRFFVWKTIATLPNIYTVTSSNFFTQFLKSAFGLPENRILSFGLPRNDALFFNNEEKLIKSIREKFPNCKIILYMPTFRTGAWTKKAFEPFDEKYGFDEDAINEVLNQQNVVLLYKPHFVDLTLINKSNHKNRIIYISDDDYSELYNFVGQCDVLMTDYSSIYFDFIITRKPVILAPFDLEEYLATCRSHYFDYSELDGIRVKNWNEFLEVISNKKYVSVNELKIKQFAEFSDGNSCKKLCNFLLEK